MKYFNPQTPYLLLILAGPFGLYVDVITSTLFPETTEVTVLFVGYSLMVLCDVIYRFRSAGHAFAVWCYHKYINMIC